ncbi:hypothetical protein QUB63_19665 [Microcoleus sp. ARI1-B5]|uniref:hypothetical protein n=1 Tax=unclassified Microcoleus TaxID=2642155 RepID=UPI002FD6A618
MEVGRSPMEVGIARSKALPWNAYIEALPRLRTREAEPPSIHSQEEPGNENKLTFRQGMNSLPQS